MRTAQPSRSAGLVCFLTAFLLLGGWRAHMRRSNRPPVSPPRSTGAGRQGRLGESTASRCSTWATTSNDQSRTGSTRCVSPGCHTFESEFGEDNNTFAGVRQSRLGVRSTAPTALGDLKTIFEFELFGTGVDEGQTTFRLRHAWGELGRLGAGQYLEPLQRYGRIPELAGILGANGYSVVPERAAPLHADQHRHEQPHARARASWRERRSGAFTPTASSSMASARGSRCPILRPPTGTRRAGAMSEPPGCCGISTGTTPSTTRSICRETPPAGDGTSARTSRPARATSCGCSSLSARAFRTK